MNQTEAAWYLFSGWRWVCLLAGGLRVGGGVEGWGWMLRHGLWSWRCWSGR